MTSNNIKKICITQVGINAYLISIIKINITSHISSALVISVLETFITFLNAELQAANEQTAKSATEID